jgi:hypothetical protein
MRGSLLGQPSGMILLNGARQAALGLTIGLAAAFGVTLLVKVI